MRKRNSARQLILEAAEEVVLGEGAGRLTLDAVAARAGLSKGGLLYHFRTKEALLEAMIERLCSTFEARTLDHMRMVDGPVSALVAHVSAALDRNVNGSVAGALLAAVANDPKLLEPMRAHLRRWVPQLAPEAPSFADRGIVWLATEGLWLLELLDLSPLNERQRREIAARLAAIARSGELAPAARARTIGGAPRRKGGASSSSAESAAAGARRGSRA